jgi:hypothetical protein
MLYANTLNSHVSKKRRYDKNARSDRRKLLHIRRSQHAFLFLYKLAFLKGLQSEQLYRSLLFPEESHIMLLCYFGTLITLKR